MPGGAGRHEVIERILKAALELFAEKGFAAATTEEIAARAGVNKAMLYYYVGSKEELFTAAVLRQLVPARETVAGVLHMPVPPLEKLRLLQGAFAQLMAKSPHLPRLMLRMLATEVERIPKPVLEAMAEVFAATAQTVREGVKAGAFRPTNPFVAHLLLVGSLALACEASKLVQRVAACGLLPVPEAFPPVETAAEIISEILLYGLANEGRTP